MTTADDPQLEALARGDIASTRDARVAAIADPLRAGELERACARINQLLRYWPDAGDVVLDAARALHADGQLDVALWAYAAVQQIDPDDPRPFQGLAALRAEQGDAARADAYLEQASYAERANLHLRRADRAVARGELELARGELAAAMAADPGRKTLLLQFAELCERTGDVEAALAAFEELDATCPPHARLISGIVRCRFRLGDDAGALAAHGRALEVVAAREPITQRLFRGQRAHALAFRPVGEFCRARGLPYVVMASAAPVEVPAPRLMPGPALPERVSVPGFELGVGVVPGATVIGDDLAVVADGELVLGSPALAPDLRQVWSAALTHTAREGRTLVLAPERPARRLSRAIVVGASTAFNYFHFMTELLPRLLLALEAGVDRGLPVLVPKRMPPQHFEALAALGPKIGEVIPIERGESVRVDAAIVATHTAFLAEDPGVPRAQLRVHPWACAAMRAEFQQPGDGGPSRVFLRRSRGFGARACVNEAELAEQLEAEGFVGVDPVRLDFAAQRALFGGAQHMVATAGAAFANVLLMPAAARATCLYKEFGGNPYYFDSVARAADITLHYVVGEPIHASHHQHSHKDFRVDARDLARALVVADDAERIDHRASAAA